MAWGKTNLPPGLVIESQSGSEYILNIGPQHPSAHGVLRLLTRLEGETIKETAPYLGYIHRGIEKMGENMTVLQYIPMSDRFDYLSSHMNNLCVCMAIEKAMNIGVPERGEVLRVMVCELQRLQSHLLWWGVFGMDLGAITAFLYGFKEREIVTDIFEEFCGARLTSNFFRPGGSSTDVPDTFIPRVRHFIEVMKPALDEYDRLVTGNVVIRERTIGIGILTPEMAVEYGCSGPTLRGSGVPFDLRVSEPYAAYDRFDFEVAVGKNGDSFDRYLVRMEEMRQSLRILEQACDQFPGGPCSTKPKAVLKLPKGSYYAQVEAARGVFGTYVVSDGGAKPWRIKTRSPNFSNLAVVNELVRGMRIADLLAVLSTLDLVIPDIDR